jgi:small GTP-binding protein domain
MPAQPGKLPVVAIVGRPNVGKSTLFNRLSGARKAIVDDMPGVTRDRNYAEALWAGRRYLIIDTGGLDLDSGRALDESVQAQSGRAVAEADVILFLFDGKGGLNPLDRVAVDLLRKSGKPVFFAVNKLDSRQRADNLYEFYALGLDPLYSISAEHGLGIPDLMDDLIADSRRIARTPTRKSARMKPNRCTSRSSVGLTSASRR